MGEEQKFAVGDKVKVIEADGYPPLLEQPEFTVESVGGDLVSVRTSRGLQAFFDFRFEKIAPAPARILYRATEYPYSASEDLTDFADGQEVEVFQFVKQGAVKFATPTVE